MADGKELHVAIAAGGTAGHINPALALAEELRARGHQVTFYGQPTRLEATLVPEAGFDFVPLKVTGFDRSRPWTLVSALVRMARAELALGKIFGERGTPDVAIGFGAYVEMPLLRWCARKGIPCLIHEQNSVIGLANRTCAPSCERICIALPAARAAFEGRTRKGAEIVLTGNPVRRSVLDADPAEGRAAIGAGEDSLVLLIFGGSLGAKHLNETVIGLKDELLSRENLICVHSTGADDYERCKESLALTEEEASRWKLMPYIDDMGAKLAAADLVVSRAGASSIAEIAARELPSILVPYPFATADHQTTNARYLVDAGAAILVTDDELDTPRFADELLPLLDDRARIAEMRGNARNLGGAGAAGKLADELEKVAL